MHHLLRLILACWRVVVLPAPSAYLIGSALGVLLRFLTVACFVITLQALVIAALPESGGLLAHAEEWALSGLPTGAPVNLALLSAGLVVVAFTLQLGVNFAYQRVLGALIERSTSHLIWADPQVSVVDCRRIATVLATSAVKISEISAFLLVLGLVVVLFSPLVLLALAAAGLVALAAFVWFRRGALRTKVRLVAVKKRLGKSPSRDATAAFFDADERHRFSKNLGIGIEGFIIGIYVAFIVTVFVFSDVSVRPEMTLYSIALVFSLRYAIVYVRELGRAFSSLLDLRAERSLK